MKKSVKTFKLKIKKSIRPKNIKSVNNKHKVKNHKLDVSATDKNI